MNNSEKYLKCFEETFELTEEEIIKMEYASSKVWDSAAHMVLISHIEDTFDIMMDAEDIIDLSSYEKGKDILNAKYNVGF